MLIELFSIGTPVVRTDGRSVGQGRGGGAMNGHVITEFSRIGRSTLLLGFANARFARARSSANQNIRSFLSTATILRLYL